MRNREVIESDAEYLFRPHVNIEFGKARTCCHLTHFLGSFIASSVVRLPIDIAIWTAAAYLGGRY